MQVIMKPTSVITTRLKLNSNGEAQKYFTHTCRLHMDKYVPFDTGALKQTAVETTNSVIYSQPYAHYQYKGMRKDGSRVVKNYTTPGTGTYWDKKMVSAEMETIEKEMQEKYGEKNANR